MAFIFAQGLIKTVNDYERICNSNKLSPKKVVFIFPGNNTHHTPKVNLFTVKSGGGLATVALFIGKVGYPTLSLPTTTMENWKNDAQQQATVEKAISDIYNAIGLGYHIMLPVRKHKKTNYFDEGLEIDNNLEPSFWGGHLPAANPELAAHYLCQLNKLIAFAKLDTSAQERHAKMDLNSTYHKAYLAGLANRKSDDLSLNIITDSSSNDQATNIVTQIESVSSNVQAANRVVEVKPDISSTKATHIDTETEKSDSLPTKVTPVINKLEPDKLDSKITSTVSEKAKMVFNFPKSYSEIYESAPTSLIKARNLLNDYTKNYSVISRFFHGHWNRHHIKQVSELVKKIDNSEVNNVKELLELLSNIKLVNDKGSLARRIAFIKIHAGEEPDLTLTRGVKN